MRCDARSAASVPPRRAARADAGAYYAPYSSPAIACCRAAAAAATLLIILPIWRHYAACLRARARCRHAMDAAAKSQAA
jgi:hypothetical protein